MANQHTTLARHTTATDESQQGSRIPSSIESLPGPFQAMALRITITLNHLKAMIQALRAPAPPIPEFSGFDHEDPKTLLKECEYRLIQMDLAKNKQIRRNSHNPAPLNTIVLYKTAGKRTSRIVSENKIPARKTLTTKRYRGRPHITNLGNYKTKH